ncbi:twin-arginine translocation pathway signal protein [Sulfurospirillum sp. T05]|uniref:Twin-arginine translocation pathway signal protein n=1 Tax=Sulfurospirillum tamanense TaxID=2813362 RepID=A0ABS2WV97_9BACT|nr:desulfoferrodoxin family protein [Sulfurospirillum tamanensis]MBN2965582.1 twin-arginine translocation pathway signal protein [Sulfurospirillum tamanensis]
MERRDAMKVLAGASLLATGAVAYDEKLIVNKNDYDFKDPKNPTEYELKHTPEISVGSADAAGFSLVEVTVGQKGIIHPSVDNHWVYQVELFAGDKRVGVVDLEPTVSRGYLAARVQLKEVKTLRAIARCNLHGNFSATLTV